VSAEFESQLPDVEDSLEQAGSSVLRVITWFSVGIAVAVVGLFVGAELRNRYRFNRRTPYDFYSKAGKQRASEFGVGI
jgi:hypothetical protein